ncbi:MAG: hypothetical protein AB7E47_03235 [Desulfovibrionaceae bacterium]
MSRLRAQVVVSAMGWKGIEVYVEGDPSRTVAKLYDDEVPALIDDLNRALKTRVVRTPSPFGDSYSFEVEQ